MKVFVSSVITGFGDCRRAARSAITTLRHDAVMAEDFGAQPNSTQIACLQGLRAADIVVLVLGEHYGAKQAGSGVSATHEEYREARSRKPVIAFVQDGTAPDPDQAAFISEVQAWEGGLFRGSFHDAGDLQVGVTRALHDYELTKAVGSVDVNTLIAQAGALLPRSDRNNYLGLAVLSVAVASGPLQQILRPLELEAPELTDSLLQAALFGAARIFDRSKGIDSRIEGVALVLAQEQGASVRLDEARAVVVSLPINQNDSMGSMRSGLPVLIEETVQARLRSALAYAEWVLERIDPTQRLTQIAVAAGLAGGDYLAWRTQREHDASPN